MPWIIEFRNKIKPAVYFFYLKANEKLIRLQEILIFVEHQLQEMQIDLYILLHLNI